MRHFTVDEANALIPTLTAVLQDLQTVHQGLVRAAGEVQEFERRAIKNGHGEHTDVFSPENNLARLRDDVADRLRYLQGVGIHLKDIEHGIVDFPTRMNDQDVYLCWRLGEDKVAYWHDVDSGYAARQPL